MDPGYGKSHKTPFLPPFVVVAVIVYLQFFPPIFFSIFFKKTNPQQVQQTVNARDATQPTPFPPDDQPPNDQRPKGMVQPRLRPQGPLLSITTADAESEKTDKTREEVKQRRNQKGVCDRPSVRPS